MGAGLVTSVVAWVAPEPGDMCIYAHGRHGRLTPDHDDHGGAGSFDSEAAVEVLAAQGDPGSFGLIMAACPRRARRTRLRITFRVSWPASSAGSGNCRS